ncbi:MAG: MFS transporter [Dehalococcoidia bacterium]
MPDPAPVNADDVMPRKGPFRLPRTFSSLRHRNYRLLWIGSVISQSGDWMDQIAFNWLIYDMTGSTVALAMVNLCRAGPMILFTLVGGVAADRIERRRLMFTTQTIAMILALVLAGLLSAGLLTVWMAFTIATLRGITNSFNQPARQSLISELVPSHDLPNAVALNSATMNLTKIIGPTIGGVLIAFVSVSGAFYLNGISFIAVLWCLQIMDIPARTKFRSKEGIFGDLVAGMSYLRRTVTLRTLVILGLVPLVLGQPYQTMLTVFAKDVFHDGGLGLGLMQSAAGLGAVCGAIYIASSRNSTRFVLRMMVGIVAFGACLLAFAASPVLPIAIIALLGVGFSMQTYNTSNNTMLQMNVDPEYRGRVLSTLFIQRGLVPLGTVVAGIAMSFVGPRVTMGIMASGVILLGVLSGPYVLKVLSSIDGGPIFAKSEDAAADSRAEGRRAAEATR